MRLKRESIFTKKPESDFRLYQKLLNQTDKRIDNVKEYIFWIVLVMFLVIGGGFLYLNERINNHIRSIHVIEVVEEVENGPVQEVEK
jgi:hypothetical protein